MKKIGTYFLLNFMLTLSVQVIFAVGLDYSKFRLNQLQYLGTHNSYKKFIQKDLYKAISIWDDELAKSLDYGHLPLSQQFHNYNVRQIELDLFADPQGGHFTQRKGLLFIGQDPNTQIDLLNEPGFKVMHIQDIDFESSCITFKGCLRKIKKWSDYHVTHLPLAILIELKDQVISDPFNIGFTQAVPTTKVILDDIDNEILSIFSRDRLLTPDDVRQHYKTLPEAIQKQGWPFVKDVLGKVYFIFDSSRSQRLLYLDGYEALRKRVMFVASGTGLPESAFIIMNNPKEQLMQIKQLVKKGYMVRTRADSGTINARENDYSQRDSAWASGAQFISTDYIESHNKFNTNYQVIIPGGGVARCNDVVSPELCF